ncbi:MAG TPA: hypothetical protein VGF69_21615 [Thermoanaerobaculia bacterium]|jgi:hypothetical protein
MTAPASVLDYLQTTSAAMDRGYTADCVAHACAVADLLLSAGREAWIGRLRDVTQLGEDVFHGPLIPRRFTGDQARTWNVHYVCCSGTDVYDPMLGAPVSIEHYSLAAFGKPLDVTEHLSPQATANLWRTGALKASFRRH